MPPKLGSKKVASRKSSSKRTRDPSPPPPSSPPPSPPHEEPVQLPWPLVTAEQQQKLHKLSRRGLSPTRYMDIDTLREVGLYDEVVTLVNGIGWSNFLFRRYPTYTEITLEILSTLKTNFVTYELPENVVITFRCLGVERAFDVVQLSQCLGLLPEGESYIHVGFNAQTAWHELTGKHDYNPSRSKASQIRRPALRYLHRVMTYSLFGRGMSHGVVNRNELFFLYAMTRSLKVYTAMFFIRHLVHVINMEGPICIGGFCTCLANALGFLAQPHVHSVVKGLDVVDKNTLLRLKICQYMDDGRYWLLDPEGNPIPPLSEEHGQGSRPPQDTPTFTPHDPGPSSYTSFHPHHPSSSSSSWNMDHMMTAILGRIDSMETTFTGYHERLEHRLSIVEGTVSSLGTHLQEMHASTAGHIYSLHQELLGLRAQLAAPTAAPIHPTADTPVHPTATTADSPMEPADRHADAPSYPTATNEDTPADPSATAATDPSAPTKDIPYDPFF